MISVVMVTKNEEGAVGEVIRSIQEAVPQAEVLIVDSSDDATPAIAESMGARVVRQHPPKGYDPAMDVALRSAAGEVVVTLDCDNTYPTEVIPEITRLVLEEGYDLVDCSRLRRKPRAMPWPNFVVNKVYAWLASLLFLRHLTDLHSGMRAYRKSLIDRLSYDPHGAALPVELLLRPLKMSCKFKVVFIDYRPRTGESKMNPIQTTWWTLVRIMRVRFRAT